MVVLASVGCDIGNFGDLGEKLLDPDVQGLDIPGQRWLEGPHYDLSVQADEDGKRFALARNEASELAIIDFQKQTHCRTGVVARYAAEAVIAPSRPALVPLLVPASDNDDAFELGFADFACAESAFSVPVSGLPGTIVTGLPDGSGTALLAKTPEQGLILVDPWAQTTRTLAESVRSIDPLEAFGHFLWVDKGVIVVSNPELEPIAYFGSQVTQVIVSPGDKQLTYLEAGTEPSAGGRLFVVNATSKEAPRQLEGDACTVNYLTVRGRRQLAYFSPCAERRLIFRDAETDTIEVISSDVLGRPAVHALGDQSLLTYVTTPNPNDSSGTLWLRRNDGEPIVVAENARIQPSAVSPGGGLLAVVDWANTGGRLIEWKDDALRDVALDVVRIDPLARLANDDLTLLGNYDGLTGDLMRLRSDLSTEVLASGVSPEGVNGRAFLANFDGRLGDLMLWNPEDGSSEELGSGVARGSFIFAQQFSAIMMLSGRDDETNTSTLRLRLLESKRELVVHDGVTEAREVAFPSPGLLYNVVVGDDAGVWFSKTL